jgi:hypothetical protein
LKGTKNFIGLFGKESQKARDALDKIINSIELMIANFLKLLNIIYLLFKINDTDFEGRNGRKAHA